MPDYVYDAAAFDNDIRIWTSWKNELHDMAAAVPVEIPEFFFGKIPWAADSYPPLHSALAALRSHLESGEVQFQGFADKLTFASDTYSQAEDDAQLVIKTVLNGLP